VRDQHAAEDLTSEAFTRTIAALRKGRGSREAYRAWTLWRPVLPGCGETRSTGRSG
jgi:hypothetical protein